LVVGAGSVGLVYAYYLQKGGKADVHVLARPRQLANLRGHSVPLVRITWFARPKEQWLLNLPASRYHDDVKTLPKDLDLVVLTVSSAALRQGTWLKDLGKFLPDTAFIACFQPGVGDLEYVLQGTGLQPKRALEGFMVMCATFITLPCRSEN
jgi:ketopantoate reductase